MASASRCCRQEPATQDYCRAITVSHTQVGSSDQTNFPVLISGTYPYLATAANGGKVQNANGYDIAFFSDQGVTPLNWDLDYFTTSRPRERLPAWVKIPALSHFTADTVIYVYYGNSSISTFQGNTNGTWDANYLSVIHFNSSGTQNDATSKNRDALNNTVGSPAFNTSGQFGYAFKWRRRVGALPKQHERTGIGAMDDIGRG